MLNELGRHSYLFSEAQNACVVWLRQSKSRLGCQAIPLKLSLRPAAFVKIKSEIEWVRQRNVFTKHQRQRCKLVKTSLVETFFCLCCLWVISSRHQRIPFFWYMKNTGLIETLISLYRSISERGRDVWDQIPDDLGTLGTTCFILKMLSWSRNIIYRWR